MLTLGESRGLWEYRGRLGELSVEEPETADTPQR
jgi:hypothetical protein